MEFEYWNLDNAVVNNCHGGYENLFHKIKEIIHLEKKGRKLLQRLISHSEPRKTIVQIHENALEQFRLNIITLRAAPSEQNRKYEQWQEIQLNDAPLNFRSCREKLKVDSGCKRFFFWLIKLSNPQIQHKFITYCANELQMLNRFKLECDFLASGSNKASEMKVCESMPSSLETRFERTVRENISEVSSPVSFGNFTMEHAFYKQRPFENYTLKFVEIPIDFKASTRFQKWKQPSIGHRTEVSFEVLRSHLSHFEYNELGYFKVKVTPPHHSRYPKRKSPRSWKMPKFKLERLAWNPLVEIERIITADARISRETITQDLVEFPTFELDHHHFLYNSIAFIDIEESTLALAGRLSPRIIDVHSVTHRQEKTKTLEAAIKDQSAISYKRAFRDDTLSDILQPQTKNRKSDHNYQTLISHEAKRLHVVKREVNGHPGISANSISTNLKVQLPVNLETLFKRDEPRRVLINVRKLQKNRKIIEYLNNATQLQLVEQELPSQCDFVISATSCIFIVRMDLFFQVQPNNTMFYEETFRILLTEFKTVIVLMKYSEIMDIADKDVFWKLRLFLQPPAFQLFLVRDISQEIGEWIDTLSNRPRNDHLFNFHPLHLLHFNKFLVQDLLSRYTFEKILIMSSMNHTELTQLMTSAQLKRIRNLMSLGW